MLDAIREATRTIPVVFVQVTDPVGNGFVASLARPGGNLTGLANYETVAGKLLELLKEIASNVTNVAVIMNPKNASNVVQFHAIQAAAQSLNVKLSKGDVQDTEDVVQFVDAMAGQPTSGLIVLASPTTNANREAIISLAMRHHLPSIYPFRYFAAGGGLQKFSAWAVRVRRFILDIRLSRLRARPQPRWRRRARSRSAGSPTRAPRRSTH